MFDETLVSLDEDAALVSPWSSAAAETVVALDAAETVVPSEAEPELELSDVDTVLMFMVVLSVPLPVTDDSVVVSVEFESPPLAFSMQLWKVEMPMSGIHSL